MSGGSQIGQKPKGRIIMYVPGRQSMKLDGSTIIWYYCGKPFYNDDVVMVKLKNGSEVKAMIKKGMLRCPLS